jgi:hypothetical protein
MLKVLEILNVLALFVTVPLVLGLFAAAFRGGRWVAREVAYRVLPVLFLACSIGTASSAAHRDLTDTGSALIGVGVSLIGWVMLAQARAALRHSE